MLHFRGGKNESVFFLKIFWKSQFLFFSDIPEFQVGGPVNQQIKNMWPNMYHKKLYTHASNITGTVETLLGDPSVVGSETRPCLKSVFLIQQVLYDHPQGLPGVGLHSSNVTQAVDLRPQGIGMCNCHISQWICVSLDYGNLYIFVKGVEMQTLRIITFHLMKVTKEI
jgi:hypothetical protein